MDIAAFASKQLSLLEAERAADITQQTILISQLPPAALVRHGLAITNLLPTAQRTGFGGRTIIELEPDNAVTASGVLQPHGVRQGDIVRVETQPAGSATKREKVEVTASGVEGVVHRVYENKVSVAVDISGDGGAVDRIWTTGKRLWIVKIANEVTFKRMEKAMGVLKDIGEKEGGRDGLIDVLFGRRSPKEAQGGHDRAEIQWFDDALNESQKEAVRFALASEEVGGSTSFLYASGSSLTRSSINSRAAGHREDTNIARDYSAVGYSTDIGLATSLAEEDTRLWPIQYLC
jgi:DNA polymerase alpha-associated DNA helicase A